MASVYNDLDVQRLLRVHPQLENLRPLLLWLQAQITSLREMRVDQNRLAQVEKRLDQIEEFIGKLENPSSPPSKFGKPGKDEEEPEGFVNLEDTPSHG